MKKKLVIIFIASLLIVKADSQIRRSSDSTQNVVSNSNGKTGRLETMNSLNLTKQQMNQLKEFRQNIKQQKDAINNDQSITDEQKQSKLRDLRKEQKEKLDSILTTEQIEKLKEQRRNSKMHKDYMNQRNSGDSLLNN